jgi:hypothetical protein
MKRGLPRIIFPSFFEVRVDVPMKHGMIKKNILALSEVAR